MSIPRADPKLNSIASGLEHPSALKKKNTILNTVRRLLEGNELLALKISIEWTIKSLNSE